MSMEEQHYRTDSFWADGTGRCGRLGMKGKNYKAFQCLHEFIIRPRTENVCVSIRLSDTLMHMEGDSLAKD